MLWMPYPMGGQGNSLKDFEEFQTFLHKRDEEHKKKNQEKRRERPKWGFLEMLTVLLFTSPFVGMAYSYCIISLNKSYVDLMSTLLK